MMNILHHKKLVQLYDAFETSIAIVVIMELITGGELFERIVEEETLTEKQVIGYMKQILYGVQHMHRKEMAHLDLKVTITLKEETFASGKIREIF